MIRVAVPLAIAAATACSGPSTSVPTGFESNCATGPRIVGESQMGVTDDGLYTDVDATIVMSGRVGGGSCVGAAYEVDR